METVCYNEKEGGHCVLRRNECRGPLWYCIKLYFVSFPFFDRNEHSASRKQGAAIHAVLFVTTFPLSHFLVF